MVVLNDSYNDYLNLIIITFSSRRDSVNTKWKNISK